MESVLWGIAIALVVLWVLVKLVFGIAGVLLHLLLVAAVVLIAYGLYRATVSRRT